MRLKPSSVAGSAGIPGYLVKDCMSIFIKPLVYLFNLAIESSQYPSIWKTSRVTPIHKGGDRCDVTNYRPVAVLPVFGKLFETALNSLLVPQISVHLDDNQHGFRSGRSTSTNLINFVNYVTAKMDAGLQVDAAYFDYQKAFDRVDNDILLEKFAAIGFNPMLLNLFASYLENRSQYVQISGFSSNDYYTRSGISQGSTLGPTQFLVMVNDLPKYLATSQCLLFADDLKVFTAIESESRCSGLQQDIDRISAWSSLNRLQFNINKCKVITFTRSHVPTVHNYRLSNTSSIERVYEITDLGLIMDSACRMLGFIMRTSYNFKNVNATIALYTAYVRSKLEYNSIIWDPYETKYSLIIEKIHRKFARYIYKKMYGYYPYMFPSLFVTGMVGLHTLQLRRKLHLAMHFYDLLHNKVYNPSVLAELGLCAPSLRGAEGERGPRRRRALFAAAVRFRTVRASNGPTARFISLINDILVQHPDLDIFCYNKQRFKLLILFYLNSKLTL